jgi:hypothetical protein
MASSYPQPPKPVYTPNQRPRPLLPISQAPLPADLPVLPFPPRRPICSGYNLTTHIIPAAFPRITPDVPLPPPLQDGWDKEKRTKWANRTAQALLDIQQKEGKGSEKVLWICVDRYTHKNWNGGTKGVTLLLVHANGFPKEVCILQADDRCLSLC